jgi:hypothetical protein
VSLCLKPTSEVKLQPELDNPRVLGRENLAERGGVPPDSCSALYYFEALDNALSAEAPQGFNRFR